ncbi:uncharacterized protein [Lolium perenne]|uniref:uncharacterized protein n=1 Tax=Lolium perenne TaxID=4522 RepID=UPI003A9947B1
MSSLAVGRGLEDLELWLGGLFTPAELAAADLLLQLSIPGARRDDQATAGESSSATTCSSRRSASPCLEDLDAEEEMEVQKRVVVEAPAVSIELDTRARKKYRLLSDLQYAATSPVATAFAPSTASCAKKRKRKRHHGEDDGSGSSSSEEATRYGGDH